MESVRLAMARHGTLLGVALLLTLFVIHLQVRLDARSSHLLVAPPPSDASRLPQVHYARLTTLGYHEAVADLAWIKVLFYFGDQVQKAGRYEDFQSHVDLVIELDPSFRRIYEWAGVLFIYSRQKISREMVEKSIRYLRMGVERYPSDGNMQYMLGFNLYFEYPPYLDDAGARREAKRDGIRHLKSAVALGTGPPWLPNMVAGLMQKNGMNQLAIQSLHESLAVVEDPEAREKIIERIRLLEAEMGQEGEAELWERFEQEWAEDYGYLDMDMFLLVRDEPVFSPEAAVEPLAESEMAIDVLDSLDPAAAGP